jgi:hypothetical protein
MFLDLILLSALIVCIGYCVVLTRKIGQLDANRVNITSMFSKFDDSVAKANENIKSLHRTSQEAINNLSQLIDKSQVISHDLMVMNDCGISVASRLEEAINLNKISLNAERVNSLSSTLSASKAEELELNNNTTSPSHKNELVYSINKISSPINTLDAKKTLNQNQYFSSLKKINTKNEI